tara:strand:+ start:243 stop:506 length:264 start_codon:yes stop_codon:yes gene_type:complete
MIKEKKEKERAIDNLSYQQDKSKKQEDMMMAKLTNMQKSVLKLKKKNSEQMGEPIKIEDIMNDPVFQTIGDKKKPATKEEIQEFLNK